MDNQIKQLKIILNNHNLSLTRPREIIFKAFIKNSPTNIRFLIKSLPNIDRATIYRNIDLFLKLKIINKIMIGFKYKLELSETFQKHHHHLYCLNCQKIIDFNEPEELNIIIQAISNSENFKINDHNLEILGLCSECQDNKV